jgi:hypothetical protein
MYTNMSNTELGVSGVSTNEFNVVTTLLERDHSDLLVKIYDQKVLLIDGRGAECQAEDRYFSYGLFEELIHIQ